MNVGEAHMDQEAAVGVPVSDMVGNAPRLCGPGLCRPVMEMMGYAPEMVAGNGGFGLAPEAKPAPTLDAFLKPAAPTMGG